MAIDSRAFRQAAAQFATGVVVIALEAAGEVRALTVNSFTAVSLEPPLVLFCLRKQSKTGAVIHDVSHFSVNILYDHQRDLSTYFAGGWKATAAPRFAFRAWEETIRLHECVTAFGCRVHAMHDAGDHWIVVGEVTGIFRAEGRCSPLVFHDGRYVTLEPARSTDDLPSLGVAWSGPWG